MNLLSLYSGVGGMDYGAHIAGIQTVAFCEAEPWNRSILSRHWPGVPIFESDEQVSAESVRALGIGRIDVIAGGPPCQPFSFAGERHGETDSRHRWPEMARIVDELRPAFVVVENVAGFSDVAEQLVRADLASIGYRSVRFDIPAAAIGAPHQRDRIFIVANSHDFRREGERRGRVLDLDRPPLRHDADGRYRQALEHSAGIGPHEGEQRCAAGLRRCAAGEGPRRAIGGYRNGAGLAESGLGGVLGRVADRLDAQLWPAPRGAAQHEWEPPRVTTERHERRKRLKALGNICVPLQVAPVFAAIVSIHESLHPERAA